MAGNKEESAIDNEKQRWEDITVKKITDKHPLRRKWFRNLSDYTVKALYTPEDIKNLDYLSDLGFPGEYPYTRGVQPTM